MVLAALFCMRHHFGFDVFVCALVARRRETYLAPILIWNFREISPFHRIDRPFWGKPAMLLLVYIREDAAAGRQPMIGNFPIVAPVFILRQRPTLLPLSDATRSGCSERCA